MAACRSPPAATALPARRPVCPQALSPTIHSAHERLGLPRSHLQGLHPLLHRPAPNPQEQTMWRLHTREARHWFCQAVHVPLSVSKDKRLKDGSQGHFSSSRPALQFP